MNLQLDQLMLNERHESEEQNNMSSEIGKLKERLRLLADLERHPGYRILVDTLNAEAKNSLYCMDKAETEFKAIQHGANYFTFTQAVAFVPNEQAKIIAMLKALNAL